MKVPVHIAAADPEDFEWSAKLMISTESWITLKRDLESARATLTRPGTELFIARDETGKRLGFILLAAYGLASSPYIGCFAVAREARNRGVGAQFLKFTEDRYRDRKNLFLLVSSFNTRAQQFYRRHGFEVVGELKEYIVPGHSEFIFHKRLP